MKPVVVETPDRVCTARAAAADAPASPCACSKAGRRLLEGPRSRTSEFVQLLRVLRDFLRGFRVLHFVGPSVTVFGSARTREDDSPLSTRVARSAPNCNAVDPRAARAVMPHSHEVIARNKRRRNS